MMQIRPGLIKVFQSDWMVAGRKATGDLFSAEHWVSGLRRGELRDS